MRYLSIGLLLISSLAGCAGGIRPQQFAGLPGEPFTCLRYASKVELTPPAQTLADDPFTKALESVYLSDKSASNDDVTDSMLFLSGGSQHGAFGAGFLNRWSELRGGLPRFRVITGISTGALQSTLAFTNESRELVNRYAILNEQELLHAHTEAHLDGSLPEKLDAAATIARKGSLTELKPLRAQLLGTGPNHKGAILSDDRLAAIARQADAGRKLFVGAVEMDSGDAYAFDMSRIAQNFVATPDSGERERLRSCYAEVLIASSSVPIAAQPTFIEGRMFIDGGARFGVLPAQLFSTAAALGGSQKASAWRGRKPNLFVIVNGDLETGVKCGLKACVGGSPGSIPPPGAALSGEHPKWSFPDLAFRSLSILINQSYASSVELSRRDAAGNWTSDGPSLARPSDPMAVHFVRIDGDDLADPALIFPVNNLREGAAADQPFDDGKLTCEKWREEDERLLRPHEFHPRYMRCLIRYGASMADKLHWQTYEP